MLKNIDDKIVELMKVLKEKQEEVKITEKASKKSWLTNCSFQSPYRNEVLNIQTASIPKLKTALIDFLNLKELSAKADKFLGLNVSDKYNGYSFSDWEQDFKTRLAVIQLHDKKEELAKLETRLNAIVSPEQRRAMELEEISKALTENN